jgi:hypothetical protein
MTRIFLHEHYVGDSHTVKIKRVPALRIPKKASDIPTLTVFIYLNLDTITAIINSTKTVIMAIVIIRFVAILSTRS